jgi:hypothetical protein
VQGHASHVLIVIILDLHIHKVKPLAIKEKNCEVTQGQGGEGRRVGWDRIFEYAWLVYSISYILAIDFPFPSRINCYSLKFLG